MLVDGAPRLCARRIFFMPEVHEMVGHRALTSVFRRHIVNRAPPCFHLDLMKVTFITSWVCFDTIMMVTGPKGLGCARRTTSEMASRPLLLSFLR